MSRDLFFKTGAKLTIEVTLKALIHESIITEALARGLLERINPEDTEHPFVTIAKARWKHKGNPSVALTTEWLGRWVCDKANIDCWSGNPTVHREALRSLGLSLAFLQAHQVAPMSVSERGVLIGTDQPFCVDNWRLSLEQATGQPTVPVFVHPELLGRRLAEFESGPDQTDAGASIAERQRIGAQPSWIKLGSLIPKSPTTGDPTAILDWILATAFARRASDIHLEPHHVSSDVRLRIDGSLHTIAQIPTPDMLKCISRLKVKAGMDIAEKRRPQDARMLVQSNAINEVELRLSTVPCAAGEKLVARIFNPEILVRQLDELGFSPRDSELWKYFVKHPHGVVIVTGPTGSGKTTTLYSALRGLARPEINITTVEDPIELVDPRFCQIQVNNEVGLDFASGIRAVLRQDPDIIMIGEIRDAASAAVAVQAALTGHLVLATMHTNDAPSAITRLLDLGIPPYLIKASVVGVIAQRLVRVLCSRCKQPESPRANDWRFLTMPLRIGTPETVFRQSGCDNCNGIGFLGRTGIYEFLTITEKIRRLITPAADTAAIRRLAVSEGMYPLRTSGALKVEAGTTTIDEILGVVPPESDENW